MTLFITLQYMCRDAGQKPPDVCSQPFRKVLLTFADFAEESAGMKSANAAAPAILDALITLGSATEAHLSYAMLGLPHHIQLAARAAQDHCRPVAARLKSRRIGSSLRIERTALTAASSQELSNKAQWDAPSDILGGDFVSLLVGNSAPPLKELGELDISETSTIAYPTRRIEHYQFVASLSLLNRSWLVAAQAWRHERCTICLVRPDDAMVGGVVSQSPNVVELQCLSGSTAALALSDKALSCIRAVCTGLQRLALRLTTIVPTTAIVHLLAGCPSLREIDLLGSGFTHLDGAFNQVVDDLISALVAHPQMRVTVSACDDLYRYLEGTAAHDQIRCLTCFGVREPFMTRNQAACDTCYVEARAGQPGGRDRKFLMEWNLSAGTCRQTTTGRIVSRWPESHPARAGWEDFEWESEDVREGPRPGRWRLSRG